MMNLLRWMLRLTLGGGAFVLLLLPVRALFGKRLPARWRRLAAAVPLIFFVAAFHAPLPKAPAVSGALPPPAPVRSAAQFVPQPAPQAPVGGKAFPYGGALAVWLGGAAVLAGFRARNWRRFSRAVTAAAKEPDAMAMETYRQVCASMQIRRPPRLVLCGGVGAPMLAGMLRPRLLLPEPCLTGERLELVLRHELTHYQCGDTLLKGAALAVATLHWWNPLAYAPLWMLEADCELACDERLALSMSAEQRKRYGMTILELMGRTRAPVAAAFSHSKRALRGRLEALLAVKRPSGALRAAGAALTAVLLAGGILAATVLAERIPYTKERLESVPDTAAVQAQAKPPERTEAPQKQAPQPDEAALLNRLLRSVEIAGGQLQFTIPADPLPDGCVWNIHISGRLPQGISVHWLEEVSDNSAWEAGKTYRAELDPAALLGEGDAGSASEICVLVASIEANGIVRATGSVWPLADWVAANGGPTAVAGTAAQTPAAEAVASAVLLSLPLEDGTLVTDANGNSYAGHVGCDYQAPVGKGVLAAADGIVVQAVADEKGGFLVVDHGGGLQTRYGLCTAFAVQEGEPVERGQQIAQMDRKGNWTPHLHFEVLLDGVPVDPAPYLEGAS